MGLLEYSTALTYVLFHLAVYGVEKEWDEVVFNQGGQACAEGLLRRGFCFPVLGFHITMCNTFAFLLKHLLQARGRCVHVFLQLKEQRFQAEQTHSSELEGMKREISRLKQELHQRNITIASASDSTSDLEQWLRTKIEREERKAVEHGVKKLEDSYAVSLRDLKTWNTILVFNRVISLQPFNKAFETLLMKSSNLWLFVWPSL